MSSGSTSRDTRAGLRISLADLTTGQHGSMTASVANGFGHILYTPKSTTCQEKPYAFHPEYSTANPRGNTWSAHTYNVAMSDEIGHFENCLALNAQFDCSKAGSQDPTLDADDSGCVPGTDSLLVRIDGCFSPDSDYDGQSYRADWPARTRTSPWTGRCTRHRSCSPARSRRGGTTRRSRSRPTCPGSRPPTRRPTRRSATGRPERIASTRRRRQFYPFFSTTSTSWGGCAWREGGKYLPGTTNNFGGSSTAEFGPLLKSVFPEAGFTTESVYDNFNSGNMPNPCRALGADSSTCNGAARTATGAGTNRRGPCLAGGAGMPVRDHW